MSAPSGPRLFLVDGYALIYRAFFALGSQPLLNSRGENTSIARGAHDFLKRLIEKHKPEYLGWVHDAGYSFRHERYPAYKATRERLEPSLQADFDTGVERITQILEAYRVPILSLEGYEADDVIGTLAKQAAAKHVNAVIVSGDKDFVQLIDEGIWILNPWHGRPGYTTEKWYDLENAVERLGVPPERVVDYLALLGDSSDNVPGVKGIGEKGAHALIAKWGSLENILAHVEEVEPTRARNALKEFGENGRLSKELVTIREDLPVEIDLDALALSTPDWNRLRELFVELEFRTAAQEAASQADAGPASTASKDETPAVVREYRVVDTVEGVETLVAKARRAPFIAIDTETVLDAGAPPIVTPLRANLVGVSIAIAPGEAYYLPFAHREHRGSQGDLALTASKAAPAAGSIAARAIAAGPPPVRNLPSIRGDEMASLRALLDDPAVRKTAHNAKYDILVMRRTGVPVRGLDFDSMLASYLLDPGRRSHAIDALAIEFLQTSMTGYDELTGKGKSQLPFDEVPVGVASEYSCADADIALRLRTLLEPKLAEVGASALLQEIELPLVEVLAEMEWHGIAIDVPWFHSLKARFAREREEVEKQIFAEAGEEFNINSNRQLGAVLFGRLGLPVRKKTSTGPSTDASVLQELADEGHVLPALLMEYRELAKLESTYLDTLPGLVNPKTGRLHTSYNQTVASTGRLASSDPNLQNIPIRRQLGKEIRKGFIPEPGWRMLAADYSQIELRLLAHLSHDPAFVEAFRQGGDIHRQTGAIIFGVPLDAVTGEMRARAKTINFATIYGQGAHSLSRQLKIDHAEAKAFIDTYFERFAGVRRFLDETVAQAKERGYVETIFKRRRYIPELKDRNFNIRAFGERTAQNSPIQGSAADLIKVAMIRIHHALAEQRMQSRMLLQVHDELVFECPPAELGALRELVVHEMTTAVALDVPLVVDVGEGPNWLETKR
ncbi:MAG: DNA polymerase I [Gemmatimonadetes bacterium]|nr:DNA polymerase I [Gemmatimonadota bacterium]MBI3504562.1 DNA polymerase I [Pseudomonadota bacterium]